MDKVQLQRDWLFAFELIVPITPPPPRHTVQELENGIRITLSSKKDPFRILGLSVWLLFWGCMIGYTLNKWVLMLGVATGTLGNSSSGSNLAILFTVVSVVPILIVVLGLGGIVIYAFLWQIAGKEIIEANANRTTLTRQIFGWKKTREYSSERVKNLRTSLPSLSDFAPTRNMQKLLGQDGPIAFDYGAKTFRFGLEIDEAEAKQIVSILRQRLSQPKVVTPSEKSR